VISNNDEITLHVTTSRYKVGKLLHLLDKTQGSGQGTYSSLMGIILHDICRAYMEAITMMDENNETCKKAQLAYQDYLDYDLNILDNSESRLVRGKN
jgi:hypothetical protein